MQVINVSDLHEHGQNTYYFDEMEGQKWEEFLESVRTSGVIEPLVVTQDKVIVSGHQRVRACKELGIKSVQCEVRIYDDKDGRSKEDWIDKDLIETNVRQRGSVGGSELKAMHRVDKLREIYGIKKGGDVKSEGAKIKTLNKCFDFEPTTIDDVAAAAGVNKKFIENFARLRDLIPEAEELLESGRITASTAASIVGKLSPDDQLALIKSLPTSEKLTAKVVQEYSQKLQEKESEYTTEAAALTNKLERQVRKNNDLETKIEQLKQKGDPDLIAKIDELEIQLRKDYERAQSYRTEVDRARKRAEAAESRAAKDREKADEASKDMNELLERLDELQKQVENGVSEDYEKLMRENASLKTKCADLEEIIEVHNSAPVAERQIEPYTMPTLLKFLEDYNMEITLYATSECLEIDAQNGNCEQVIEFVDNIVSQLFVLKNKIRTIEEAA